MRVAAKYVPLALALAAACERDDLAPIVPGPPDLPSPPEPLAPRCGDGLANDVEVCLRSDAVLLPYAHRFIRYADFDGNGQRDYFAINTHFEVFWPLFFTGGFDNGGPKPVTYAAFPNHEIFRAEVLDFNGDGRSDLVGATQFYYPSGDIVTTETRLLVWRNVGNYEFEEAQNTPVELASFAAGDIDGDGLTELLAVVAGTGGYVWAYVPDTDTIEYVWDLDLKPLQVVGSPVVVAADYNGDIHADFVLMDGSGRAWRIVGGPDHQLTILDPQAPVVLTPESETLYAPDLDGDGITDLAAVRRISNSRDHTISLALGQPGGGFTALASFDTGHDLTYFGGGFFGGLPEHKHLGFYDLDGSGELALVYAPYRQPALIIHPRIAETLGATPTIIPLDFPANSVFVDDFEGDGEDAIYVTMSDNVKVKPSKEVPGGVISTHYLVRFTPDP
ncbi:MAG TPA: VCBS repeat-containing protein [Nannocystis sp.]|jgi:hypothetical protein